MAPTDTSDANNVADAPPTLFFNSTIIFSAIFLPTPGAVAIVFASPVAIAHRLSTLRNMDRIIVLDKGCIVESGTHAQLLRSGGAYSKLWKMQTGGFVGE